MGLEASKTKVLAGSLLLEAGRADPFQSTYGFWKLPVT